MPVSELLAVRHGESTANVAREQAEASGAEVIAVEARDADVPLTDLGVRQATELGRWLRSDAADRLPTAVWVSPYVRARQTADAVLAGAGLDLPRTIDERLRDKELGILDMLTGRGIRARYPDEAQRRRWIGKFYYRAPGGESWADVVLRLRTALADLDRVEDGGRVLLVTHDAVINLLRYVCERLDEKGVLELARSQPVLNTGLTRIVRDPSGSWRTVDANRHDHLLPEFAGEDLRTLHPAATERPAGRSGR